MPQASAPEMAASAASSAASVAAPIPFLRHDPAGLEPGGVGVGNALVIVLLIAGPALWWLRRSAAGRRLDATPELQRLFGGASPRSLRVVESARLTPKTSAHVLEWKSRQWLVVCTDGATTVVTQDDAPAQGAGS